MVYYSTSLYLYSTEIDPRRNLYIDEISQYLNGKDVRGFTDFKRFTPAESVTVRIPVDDAAPAIGGYLDEKCNYAMVEYSDETGVYYFDWYYFVTSIEMVADGTLSVTLQLDALNTFRNWTGALTDRTFVKRMTVARWNSDGKPTRNYWNVHEDITGEIFKISESKIKEPTPTYLIYKGLTGVPSLTATSESGFIMQNNAIVKNSWFENVYPSDGNNTAYCFHSPQAVAKTVTLRFSYDGEAVEKTLTTSKNVYIGYCWMANESDVRQGSIVFVIDSDGSFVYQYSKTSKTTTNWALRSFEFEIACANTLLSRVEVRCTSTTDPSAISFDSDFEYYSTESISDLDRTQTSIAKIVEIPYAPDISQYGQFVLAYDTDAKKETCDLVFDTFEPSLSLDMSIKFPAFDAANRDATGINRSIKGMDILYDPKCYSADYAYYKIVYDSYSTTVSLSNLPRDVDSYVLKFIPSSSISSSCIFLLKAIKDSSYVAFENVNEDYPFMISSDRNNEIPLYSSEWLNYLRTGYNYDKKSNAIGITTSVLSTIGAVVSGIATIASGGATAAATVPTMVGMAGAAIGGWASTASTINSQLARETQMKNQAASVSSLNDLSLFKQYGGGAVKLEYWSASSEYRNRLGQLFFYRGYAINGCTKPSLHTRKYFDYIECVPSWSGSFIKKTPPQFISLLNDRLAQGVTIIHHYDNAWDIAQEKGNIEA